ncbi:MAG: NAD(P)-dependent oxidoreductase [Haloferacaceae archaeon]
METDGDGPTVAVLREGTEGLDSRDYAAALRDEGLDAVHAPTPAAERRLVGEAPVVTGVRVDEGLVDQFDGVRLFAAASSGTDHLPVAAMTDRGVVVTNAAGIHAPGIAEQVCAHLLTFARRLHRAPRRQERREWRHWQAGELGGSTVTVVGQGAVGTATVERLDAFGVERLAVRHSPEKGGPADEVVGYDAVHDALARTDYLVLACPLTDETRELVDAAALATLPPEAVVVNVARGGVVDQRALAEALGEEAVRGAALDVTDPEPLPPESPLWRLESCLITPHVGGSTPRHWDRLAAIVAENVDHLASGGDPAALRNLVAV